MATRKQRRQMEQSKFPLILALNAAGNPQQWITYEKSAFYQAKGKVLWVGSQQEFTLRGGYNAITGDRSTMNINTIVAIDGRIKGTRDVPPLTNRTLFGRDRHLCAYCGSQYGRKQLTRDHIVPRSKGGVDKWDNVVTACVGCNQWKRDRTPQEADMNMFYIPYTPSFSEHLILLNKKILSDQMDFLLKSVGKHSRLFQYN